MTEEERQRRLADLGAQGRQAMRDYEKAIAEMKAAQAKKRANRPRKQVAKATPPH